MSRCEGLEVCGVSGFALGSEGEGGIGREIGWGEFAGLEARPCGGGNHGSVVSGKSQRGKGDMETAASCFRGEAGAELAVGGNSASDEDAGGTERFLGGEGFLEQVADDGMLKAGDEIEGLWIEGS